MSNATSAASSRVVLDWRKAQVSGQPDAGHLARLIAEHTPGRGAAA